MLRLNETLFVEHKRALSDEGNYGLAEAVAAFANTFGGWLLLNVHNGDVVTSDPDWGDTPLVDAVRDRLRGQVDPLPPFEARLIALDKGPVGVVRVYESADTPHILMRSGSVVIREPAGVFRASKARKPGSNTTEEVRYKVEQVASRIQLLELALKGERARERVEALMAPANVTPLTAATGLRFERAAGDVLQPHAEVGPAVFVRLMPLTPTERFSAWATTHEAQAAAIRALEHLFDIRGLGPDWPTPHPAGVVVAGEVPNHTRLLRDSIRQPIRATAAVAVDQAGIVTAAMRYRAPDEGHRQWHSARAVEAEMLMPLVVAASRVLVEGHFLGRTQCHVVMNRLSDVLLLERAAERGPAAYVPVGGVIDLPSHQDELCAFVQRMVNAFARSAGVPAWDRSDGSAM